MLNFEDIANRKLTKMRIEIEDKPAMILLDSCSSANIVSESFLTNYLNKNMTQVYGPVGCVKGIGQSVTYDRGRIELTLNILGRRYREESIVMNEPGIPGSVLLSAMAMGRCGLSLNFRERKIRSADTRKEVSFLLEEDRFLINRARLSERHFSKQIKVKGHNHINDPGNSKLSNPSKDEYHYKRNDHQIDSALQGNHETSKYKNEMVPCSTLSHEPRDNESTGKIV